MTKAGKRIEKMRASPSGWRIESLEAIARRYEIEVRKTGGSHFVFMHPNSERAITIPYKRPIKPVYVTQFLALLDDLSGMMQHQSEYPFELRPLDEEEGGGWLIVFSDLPGCMSDGETPEEAIENGKDAVAAWIQAARESGREVPRPGELPSGKFIARVPRSLHARLAIRARQEGVSMNALVSAFLAEGMGRRERL